MKIKQLSQKSKFKLFKNSSFIYDKITVNLKDVTIWRGKVNNEKKANLYYVTISKNKITENDKTYNT